MLDPKDPKATPVLPAQRAIRDRLVHRDQRVIPVQKVRRDPKAK